MSGGRKWAFVLLMLALTAVFVALGTWQWMRLQEKETLIRTVNERLDDEPVPYTANTEEGFYDYRPIIVSGRYLPADTVLVFTSLSQPKGELGGPGYWVMTPLSLEAGGTIWVNRGFVPESARPDFAAGGEVETGVVTLTGIAIPSERANSFTPAANAAGRLEWVRDVTRLSALASGLAEPIADVYLDLPAGPSDALPQGGETVVRFPNNHLGYALTWFGFAILTPILLIFWLRRQGPGRRP
jgi:surfeit locus 1 family protein